ncbi:MAG: sugar ABC transporter permease YjfF [Lachnospiraceae bacterium]|nr:sugar ABC transporter permease YjfF [Lachnospiraceae bacterium]
MENKTSNTNFFKKFTNKIGSMTETNLLLTITITVFVLMYLGAMLFLQGGFLTPQNFFQMLNENATLIVLACGLSVVMITGGIDISVGGVTGLVTMCSAVYLGEDSSKSMWVVLLIALGIGLAFGVVQGLLVAYLDIQPFIVTLAGMFFAKGMTTIVSTKPTDIKHEGLMALKDTKIVVPGMSYVNSHDIRLDSYVEIGVLIALFVVLVLFVVLRWTKLGRSFYAVGGNSQSALMLGINVKRTKFLSHVLCGLLAGLGGFLFLLHAGSGSPSNGGGYEMNAIASSIIGGTMLTGGVGNIIGTLFGVTSLSTIKTIVASAGLQDGWWTGITVGFMLCLFLVIQSIVVGRKKK